MIITLTKCDGLFLLLAGGPTISSLVFNDMEVENLNDKENVYLFNMKMQFNIFKIVVSLSLFVEYTVSMYDSRRKIKHWNITYTYYSASTMSPDSSKDYSKSFIYSYTSFVIKTKFAISAGISYNLVHIEKN